MSKSISLILPAYNYEDKVIERTSIAYQYLENECSVGNFKDFEVIVVDDGSSDSSFEKLETLKLDKLKILRLDENQGKGQAVKEGVLAASKDIVCFTDIDLPFDLSFLNYSARLIKENHGFDIVLGDRSLSSSNYYQKLSKKRLLSTMVFKTIVRVLVTGEIFDTQCGIKAFNNKVAKELFPLLQIKGFAFDVELIYLALKYNLAIRKVPVLYKKNQPSSVSMIAAPFKMFFDILKIPIRWYRGIYKSSYLESKSNNRYWETA